MQGYLHWITAMCISISYTSCLPRQSDKKAKRISYAIYKGDKYNTKVYDCTYVQVCIIVEKVSKNERVQVWDTTLDAKQLKQYPSFGKALSQTVVVPDISCRNEHFEVRYILIYNSKGNKLEMEDQTIVEGNTTNLEIRV